MMDISSGGEIDIPAGLDKYRIVNVGDAPLSYHLRIAGTYRTDEIDAVEYAWVRKIRDFEFILLTEGSTWLWCQDLGSVPVHPGDVVFIPPGFVHGWAYRAQTHRVAHFDFIANTALRPYENLVSLNATVAGPGRTIPAPVFHLISGQLDVPMRIPLVTSARTPSLWSERMAELLALHAKGDRLCLADRAAICGILSWMVRTVAADAQFHGITEPVTKDTALQKLVHDLDDVDESLRLQSLSVAELARLAGLGETAFRAAFRAFTGRSPRNYIENRRIERAMHLLAATNRTVKSIASGEGYEDVYHFSRVFKRVAGVAPSQFRLNTRGEAL